VLSAGAPPAVYTPIKTGFGAGTKEFADRANALRIIIADVERVDGAGREQLIQLACDIDDMTPEYLAAVADRVLSDGALDVVLVPVIMKKGRPGVRLEVLCSPKSAASLEAMILSETSTIGVRRTEVSRIALPRRISAVAVFGESVNVKFVTLPDGTMRAKPEFDDVMRVALATNRRPSDIYELAVAEAERV
jgi:uncharacterized protein (DUF111 family)